LNNSLILYKRLIWSPIQSKSSLDVRQARKLAPSYFIDFRQHILQEFHIPTKSNNEINCRNLNIFFLLRGNYIAHPRNPSGQIQRQLINENQILDELKIKFENFSSIHFTFNHFEQLSIEEQLTIITQTDIFLGMHGAGLTHVMFLKSNRILIELTTFEWQRQRHFELIASMNKINYQRCVIQNGHPTTAEIIFNCITNELFRICPI
jgi:glycoprotein 2-beta-D-xylosyltransferase